MRLTLEELVPRYQGDLYRAAYAVCGDRQEAEDAVQDTLLRYFRSRREFDSEEHIKAWLLRVCINRSRDFVRSFWRRNRESIEDCAASLVFEDSQDRELFTAVMQLPRAYRTVIFLHYYEGYGIREIGEITGAGENTVKSRLHRARALLREKLKEGWQDEE